jgi:hypothetical protein
MRKNGSVRAAKNLFYVIKLKHVINVIKYYAKNTSGLYRMVENFYVNGVIYK